MRCKHAKPSTNAKAPHVMSNKDEMKEIGVDTRKPHIDDQTEVVAMVGVADAVPGKPAVVISFEYAYITYLAVMRPRREVALTRHTEAPVGALFGHNLIKFTTSPCANHHVHVREAADIQEQGNTVMEYHHLSCLGVIIWQYMKHFIPYSQVAT